MKTCKYNANMRVLLDSVIYQCSEDFKLTKQTRLVIVTLRIN